MKVISLVLHAFQECLVGPHDCSDEQQHNSGGIHQLAGEASPIMVEASLLGGDCHIHFQQKECDGGAAQLLHHMKNLPSVVRLILDLFATGLSKTLPVYTSVLPNNMSWKENVSQLPWDSVYALPFFVVICQVLNKVWMSSGLKMTLVALCCLSLWAHQENSFGNVTY